MVRLLIQKTETYLLVGLEEYQGTLKETYLLVGLEEDQGTLK